ncbi:MAG TPA: polysaccharide biosynthesis/export family protein [Candidatus Binatia bacterium]|nr:polysaccharide biosynthesis/export family protein [Candidatus Binatia bacterium]
MYSRRATWAKRILMLASAALLAAGGANSYAQDSAPQPGAVSTTVAQPVLPASSEANGGAKDVARATPLPPTDVPSSRVAAIQPESYVIGIGDGLDVSVWREPELSKTIAVRPDGMISLPLVGEIKAVGLTPVQLQNQLTASLTKVVSDPQVTVIVVSVNSLSFNIMGEVYKPGYYPLTKPITVLDAIALSGGFRDFAKEKKIYILRTSADGKQQKIRFNYKDVIKGRNMQQNILIQPRDTLVVP